MTPKQMEDGIESLIVALVMVVAIAPFVVVGWLWRLATAWDHRN